MRIQGNSPYFGMQKKYYDPEYTEDGLIGEKNKLSNSINKSLRLLENRIEPTLYHLDTSPLIKNNKYDIFNDAEPPEDMNQMFKAMSDLFWQMKKISTENARANLYLARCLGVNPDIKGKREDDIGIY